jgi:putative tryptophan/tyrosine transport system substrate-binding protein
MKRREFITLLGGAVATWPAPAQAQRNVPVVGLVSIGASATDVGLFGPFLDQMRQLGYSDGQNVILERRFAAGHDQQINHFVAELVSRPVDVIVVTGTRESIAASEATASIPIVMIVNPDPIGLGLAQTLARPGGNVTGLTDMDFSIYGKRIEILKLAVPGLKKAGLLMSGGKLSYRRHSEWARSVEADANTLGV